MVLRQEHKAGEKMFVDWAGGNERPRSLGDLRRSLPAPFHRPDFPTAGLALARAQPFGSWETPA